MLAVRRETVNKLAEKLSFSASAKVLLARLILGDYSLLVLNEPTNHLDIETQITHLGALRDYPM